MRFFNPETPTSFPVMLPWLSAIVAQALGYKFWPLRSLCHDIRSYLFVLFLIRWSEESNTPFVIPTGLSAPVS
jgi:hypothetical protein